MSQGTIFVVDDDSGNLGLLFNTLKKEGFEIFTYRSGDAVLTSITQPNTVLPDLILLDVLMPGKDGFETCHCLKANEDTQHIPIIFMTALNDAVDELKGLQLGAVDYITKPFEMKTVIARINTQLTLQRMQTALQEQNIRLQQEISERQQAEKALEHQNERLLLLNRVGQVFSSSLELTHVLEKALEEIKRLLDAFSISFWLNVPKTGELACMHAKGPGSEKLLQWRLAPGQGITGWAFTHDQSLLVPDTRADERHFKDVDEQTGVTVRSMLSIPLRVKGAVIGVLNLVDPRVNHFTQNELILLEPIAAEVAIAIENARLYTLAQQEIVERTQAEEALRESEERYRNLVESSPIPILVHCEERCVFLNREAIRTLGGKTLDDFLNTSIWDVVHPDYHHIRRQRLKKIYANAKTAPLLEEQFLRLNSTIIDVEVMESKTTYMGKPALQVVFRDVTKLKKTEHALRKSQQLLAKLFTSLTEVVLVVEPENRTILLCNPAVERIFGYPEGEVFGKSIEFFHLDQTMYQRFEEHLFLTLDAKETFYAETELRRKDGSIFIAENTAMEIIGDSGERTGVVWVIRDITERKKAEAQLLNAHNELKQKNAQLAELNASKDKLFSIISHDLRTPFSVVLGYSELLEENFGRYSDDEIKDLVGRIRSSAGKLNALLENLLTWSRIQRGAMICSPERINLYEIVEENIELFFSKADQKQITLTNSIETETTAYADYHMVNTAFRNLLSNALKFTPSGGRITISSQPYEGYLEIAVSDTGIGINREDMAKLFRFDVQYTNTGIDGERGTGLGLNLCKDLIEKNGGTIRVESTVGEGTTFMFSLPTV